MEIYKTTIAGTAVNVIFVGSVYLFHNSYYGYIAHAKRSELRQERGHEFFTLTTGNHHTIGGRCSGSALESGVKRFITKLEKQHGAAVVDYETHTADLANAWLDLESGFKFI